MYCTSYPMILKISHFTTFHDCLDYFNDLLFIYYYYYYDIIIIYYYLEKEKEKREAMGGTGGSPPKFRIRKAK